MSTKIAGMARSNAACWELSAEGGGVDIQALSPIQTEILFASTTSCSEPLRVVRQPGRVGRRKGATTMRTPAMSASRRAVIALLPAALAACVVAPAPRREGPPIATVGVTIAPPP